MPPRIPASERLRHKVLIALNDDQYNTLMDEARARDLAPSIIGRLAFVEGLPEIRRKRPVVRGEDACVKRKAKAGADAS